MRRTIAQWLISRSIDCGREVPLWVRTWLLDEEDGRFEAAAKDHATRLRRDAAAWRALAPAATGAAVRNDRYSGLGGWATRSVRMAALAAVAVVAGTIYWVSSQHEMSQPEQVAARDPHHAASATSAADAELLVALLGEGQTAWEGFFGRIASTTPRDIAGPNQKALDASVEAAFDFFAYRLPASTAKVAGLDRASATIKAPDTLLRLWWDDRGA
jgi:hypothetical protein